MKKSWIILFSVLLLMSFVIAAETPSAGIGGEDVEEIQGVIGNYSPLDESGEVDLDKYKPFITRAEFRIAGINMWLEENASWLKVVFGMVPSITWIFAFVIYFWLFFFMTLVLNGNVFNFAFSDKKLDMMFFETTWGNIVGALVFVILVVTKILLGLSLFALYSWRLLWDTVLPWGTLGIVVIVAITAVLAILFPAAATIIFKNIRAKLEEKKKDRLIKKQEEAIEIVEKIGEGTTGE